MKKFLFIRWIEAYEFIAKSQMMLWAFIGRPDIAERISNEGSAWAEDRAWFRAIRRLK